MFLAVLVGHALALLAEMFLESGIHDEFLTDRVTGKLPGELVLPSVLLVRVRGVDDFVVIVFDLAMIGLDGVGDASHDGSSEEW
jgi:hypothetical protein